MELPLSREFRGREFLRVPGLSAKPRDAEDLVQDVYVRFAGEALQLFDNVDLYSLMAEILKINAVKTDGSIAPLCSI